MTKKEMDIYEPSGLNYKGIAMKKDKCVQAVYAAFHLKTWANVDDLLAAMLAMRLIDTVNVWTDWDDVGGEA